MTFLILNILPFWHADVLQMNAEDFLERLQVLQGLWEKETTAFDTAIDALMVKTANILCSYSSQWTEVTDTLLRKPHGIFSLTISATIIEFIIISMPENMSHSTRGALGRPEQYPNLHTTFIHKPFHHIVKDPHKCQDTEVWCVWWWGWLKSWFIHGRQGLIISA